MPNTNNLTTLLSPRTVARDATAGLVVFLVALPLCLGISLASDAPLTSGLITGIVGGLVVGMLSGSHTSVAGPAAGLTAVVALQISKLGSFEALLAAVVLAGVLQLLLGALRAGFIAAFFPSSVIKGLLAAIGIILILKQMPHLVGHDADAVGEMDFLQSDGKNTFSELLSIFGDFHLGAALIGLGGVVLLWAWDRISILKKSPVPAPLVVVLFGLALNGLFKALGTGLEVTGNHLVQVPATGGVQAAAKQLLAHPDWSILSNPAVYVAAVTLALVATLETLLNLDAVDGIDPKQRRSPPNRELIAQGAGNICAGMLGGLPMTSVIIRSSVNINAGNETKLSAVFHGVFLLGAVLLFPNIINMIQLSALAAILIMTGFKLARPSLFKQMWREGYGQFLPFVLTIAVIVLTDLLTGVLLGLGISLFFVLRSNFMRSLKITKERHPTGHLTRIKLANQVSFLNRAVLDKTLHGVPEGGRVIIDASDTDYIDLDILDLLLDFRDKTAPAHKVEAIFLGFEKHSSELENGEHLVEHTTKDLRSSLSSRDILNLLKEGNERFCKGEQLPRNLMRQVEGTAPGQSPLAVIFSCIDSRTPAEHVFDLGIRDIFSVRIAGNIAQPDVLASIEFGCGPAGAKLVVVMGHTACGAVASAVQLKESNTTASEATGCEHLHVVIDEIQQSIAPEDTPMASDDAYVDTVAQRNVERTIDELMKKSGAIQRLVERGTIEIVGAMYDVRTGVVRFLSPREREAV